jgi:hypothetical protein
MEISERILGYRLGIIALSFATLSSALFLGFAASRAQVSPADDRPIPICMVSGGFRMGLPADLVMNCPEVFRLGVISFAGFAVTLTLTLLTGKCAVITSKHRVLPYLTHLAVASLTVGIINLIGVYLSEYLGGMGKLNRVFIIVLPVVVTLVHFPARKFPLLVIPVGFFGFFGLVLVAILTGLPLD